MRDMDEEDYFDRGSIYTDIMFTEKEILKQFQLSNQYVHTYIKTWIDKGYDNKTYESSYDAMRANVNLTNFNAVVNYGQPYKLIYNFEELFDYYTYGKKNRR